VGTVVCAGPGAMVAAAASGGRGDERRARWRGERDRPGRGGRGEGFFSFLTLVIIF